MVEIKTNRPIITTRPAGGTVEVNPKVSGGQKGLSGDLGQVVTLGTVAGAINLSSYALETQTFTLTTGASNLTLAGADMPVVLTGFTGSFSIRILQGATPRTLTLDAAIKKSFGNAPALTAIAGAIDVLTFMWTGLEWIAMLSASAIA